MLSTDYKNQSSRDRVDYKFDCRPQSLEFREPEFFCRLETTNCSVLNFSALRAATFIKKYIEMQKNIGRKVLKFFCAACGHLHLENNQEQIKILVYEKFSALRAAESFGL